MGKRILIVDDEEDLAMMVGMNLEQTGRYETRGVTAAGQVLAAAREFRPDAVLLDVMMPDMDGGDVARLLRQEPATRDTPIIFVTALVGGEEAPIGGMLSGGSRFIPKPVSFAELIEAIEEMTAGVGTGDAGEAAETYEVAG